MGKVRVGMCQLRVVYGDAEDNLARAAGLVRDAASQGADICVIPECADLGWANPHALELASPIPGPVSDAYCAMARENGVYVVAGITERDGERAYNAAILVSPEGEILFKHRKINVLTGVEDVYSVGDRLGVTETKLGKIGIDICADNWKQSLPIGHALARMGAQIILSPSSWAVLPDRDLAKNPFGSTWTIPYEELSRIYGIPVVGEQRRARHRGQLGGPQGHWRLHRLRQQRRDALHAPLRRGPGVRARRGGRGPRARAQRHRARRLRLRAAEGAWWRGVTVRQPARG